MDLLDFDGAQDLYFNETLPESVPELLARASAEYAEGTAEAPLLKAAELAPESLSVLVALYRFYYYQHRLADTYRVAERAIAVSGGTLGFPADWRELAPEHLAAGAEKSMGLVRFYLLSLKGAGWLKMRMNEPAGAREILEKLATLDTANRLGIKDLLKLLDDMEAGDEAALA
jgi:hypothetical protein